MTIHVKRLCCLYILAVDVRRKTTALLVPE